MGKRLTIGAVIGNANSPHTKDIMNGIQDAADKYGLNVMYLLGVHMASTFNSEFESQMIDYGFDYQYNIIYDYALLADCDALIISYGSICIFLDIPNKEKFLNKFSGIPYVLLEDRDETGRGSSLMSNNYDGMSRVVEHLVAVHRIKRFAYLGGPKGNTDALERRKGFEDVLRRHGIEIKDEMFEYGDFSSRVEAKVNSLLDKNPNVQAIVCANDLMADTAYKECVKRGLVVGKDVAITGYDDCDVAASMTPPLTTVLQNGFDMGYESVIKALELIETKQPESTYVPTVVKIRASCGCKNVVKYNFPKAETKYKQAYVEGIVKGIVSKSLLSSANNDVREGVVNLIRPIVTKIHEKMMRDDKAVVIDKKTLMNDLNAVLTSRYKDYISVVDLADSVGALLSDRIQTEKNPDRIAAYTTILLSIQKHVQAASAKSDKDKMDKYQNDTMFMPYISRGMMIHIDDEEEFYKSAMEMMACMGVKSAYLYLHEEPIVHYKNDEWTCPKSMCLAASLQNGQPIAYNISNRPILCADKQMSYYIDREDSYRMCVYDLFMGEVQYGVLVTETDPKNMLLMNLASLQISSAMSSREAYIAQKELKKELEVALEDVKKKNEVLGFISEYDQLTGCLNRRGYIEQAQTLLSENAGEKACIIISDLDHLKEINDTFGHAEGDFAIKSSANILRDALGADTVVARIGGDEFLAIYHRDDEECSGKELSRRIKNASDKFEEISTKPYYVEVSVGYYEFTCDPKLDLQFLMAEADKILYEAKIHRRASIKK